MCDWRGLSADRLFAPNPFDPGTDLLGCPQCKDTGCFYITCDEADCWEHVSCGTSTLGGYRQTCVEHKPAAEAEEKGE